MQPVQVTRPARPRHNKGRLWLRFPKLCDARLEALIRSNHVVHLNGIKIRRAHDAPKPRAIPYR
jgi:hypothetical protein